ncbi:MAG: L-threonylcarbamoyladenylate synthase [Chitinophagaceae bacterium]
MADFIIDINHCVEVLEKGGLILFPTDTIWGIGCDATNESAVDRILDLKNRSSSKGLIVLLEDERDISLYSSQAGIRIFDYIHGITKPTTVIYNGGRNVAANILPEDGSLAIRLVKEPFCIQLLKRFDKPIVSTSANLHGFPSPLIFKDIDIAIKNAVDYVVHHRQEDEEAGEASAVIKWMPDGSLEIIRP